jgi:hypothetical protein
MRLDAAMVGNGSFVVRLANDVPLVAMLLVEVAAETCRTTVPSPF